MDTKEFLETLLPEEGVKFVARWFDIPNHPRKGIFMHKPFYDLDEMADNIKWHASKGNTVYHACSTYKEVKYITTKNGKEVPAGRTKDNALAARALWLDFDVGKEAAHSYTSKKDAIDSLAAMIKALRLPTPMVVDSGNGVHAYFLLDEALPRSEWEELANLFRATCDSFGLKYDPSRSSDIASILRPPGTFNLKNPDNPKPVVVKREGVRRPVSFYKETFQAYLDEHGITVAPLKTMDFGGLNSDLITNIEYPDSHAAVIVQHCQQLKQFSETGGTSEPVWYACLGLLKHCVDGEVAAHEWGAKHPDYDEGMTNDKMAQWGFGPPTCDKFRDINAEGCSGCERSCKSPIQLGHVMPENVEHTPIQVEDDDTPQEQLHVGPGSEFWPAGYRVANGRLEVARENEDDTVTYVPLASPPFWLLNEIRDESGEYMLHIRAEIKEGKFSDFDIPTSCTSSADKLKSALAANRVFALSPSPKAGFEMQNSIIQQALAMARKRDEINTFTQMGWTPDKRKFLLGDSLIGDTGVTAVRVGSSIHNVNKGEHALIGAKSIKGSLEEYRDGVNHLYNREGYEPYQYVLSSCLGGYLSPFVSDDNWHGIPLAIYSSRSGYGKTTAAAIGFNAMCRNVKQRSSDSTLRGFKKMLSVYGSLPVFYDELTDKINAVEAKDLLYNWSTGQERSGLLPDGSIRTRGEAWNNMGVVTTNKSVLYKLTETSSDPEATQVRVLEIDLAEYIPHKPAKVDQQLAIHLSTNVYGVATERFIRAVMKNREQIEDQIQKEFHDITNRLPEDAAVMSRFLCYHAACSVVGAKVGKKLGLWDFSVAGIKAFIVKHIKRQLDKITEYRVSPEDRFAAMMADFNGKIIVTHRYDTLDKRKNSIEEPLVRVLGEIVGRYAMGCPATKSDIGDPGRLYISVNAINTWCSKNELNAAEIRNEWVNAGLVETQRGATSKGEKKVRLALGVPTLANSQTRCVEFVVSKVRDAIPEVDAHTKADVVPLKKAGGE
jgi:Fe-S cluster assembly ATPase SufC